MSDYSVTQARDPASDASATRPSMAFRCAEAIYCRKRKVSQNSNCVWQMLHTESSGLCATFPPPPAAGPGACPLYGRTATDQPQRAQTGGELQAIFTWTANVAVGFGAVEVAEELVDEEVALVRVELAAAEGVPAVLFPLAVGAMDPLEFAATEEEEATTEDCVGIVMLRDCVPAGACAEAGWLRTASSATSRTTRNADAVRAIVICSTVNDERRKAREDEMQKSPRLKDGGMASRTRGNQAEASLAGRQNPLLV